jgi:hypothetical protein
MLGRIVGATLIMTATLPSSAQVPPPPSLPGQDRVSGELVRSIETKNSAAYAALLSDAVHVFEDGKEVARSKTDWMNTFGKKLSADGVVFKMSPGFHLQDAFFLSSILIQLGAGAATFQHIAAGPTTRLPMTSLTERLLRYGVSAEELPS